MEEKSLQDLHEEILVKLTQLNLAIDRIIKKQYEKECSTASTN